MHHYHSSPKLNLVRKPFDTIPTTQQNRTNSAPARDTCETPLKTALIKPHAFDGKLKTKTALLLLAIFFIPLVLTAPAVGMAAELTLAWDAVSPRPDGYHVYQREDGKNYNYSAPAWSGAEPRCSLNGLSADMEYYFVVRAYIGSEESGDSNEVSFIAESQTTTAYYTINASSGTNGTISPSGSRTVPAGNSLAYTISADSGYHVADVQVDGASIGAVGNHTFTNIGADHTISAVFERANEPPSAEAGQNQTVTSGDKVRLDGSGSYDPEGGKLSYLWAQASGTVVQLSSAVRSTPSFTAPIVSAGQTGVLVFELQVTDNQGLQGRDTCIVRVNPALPVDTDGDGIRDDADAFPDDPSESVDTDSDGIGDNRDLDDDGDGMPDTWEVQYGLDPLVDNGNDDADRDGVVNFLEYQTGGDPTVYDQKHAPARPEIVYPADNATDVSTRALFIASDFSDADADDYLDASEWRIIRKNDRSIVYQSTRSYWSLNYLRVPRLILDSDTTYTCQVRYYDNQGQASPWSSPLTFTTSSGGSYYYRSTAAPTSLITAVATVTPPTALDENETSADVDPQHLRTLQTLDRKSVIAISVEESADSMLSDVMIIDPIADELEDEFKDLEAFDLFTYRIAVGAPGQECSVACYNTDNIVPMDRWICNGADGLWTDCTAKKASGDDTPEMARTIQDGGPDDVDGVANGVIVAIAGVGTTTDDATANPGASIVTTPDASDKGGCFIGSLLWGDGNSK